MATSITRLYGLGLTPGKLRGLQRISNPNGTLSMVATDQNSSMIKMMKAATGKAADAEANAQAIGAVGSVQNQNAIAHSRPASHTATISTSSRHCGRSATV